MTTLISDPAVERRLKAERAASGADRYDEVWEGTYMMTPMPNVEHQDIVNGFAAVLQQVVRWPGLGMVMPGANVSDRETDWESNYRVPDIAVFLNNGKAKNCGTHWLGGPDWVVEVTSPNDRTREKMDFYTSLGTRELLVVHRSPWQLELYRMEGQRLSEVARCSLQVQTPLASNVLPLELLLVDAEPRPQIEVRSTETGENWTI